MTVPSDRKEAELGALLQSIEPLKRDELLAGFGYVRLAVVERYENANAELAVERYENALREIDACSTLEGVKWAARAALAGTEETPEDTRCPDCFGKGLANQDDRPGLLIGAYGEDECRRCRGTGVLAGTEESQ